MERADNAILYAGVDELNVIKEQVLELEGYRGKNAELLREENRLERLIGSKEKDLAEEIGTTLKRRRTELTETFENQIETQKNRQKKIRARKEKEKGGKMSERIALETAEYAERNQAILLEIKAALKKDKTPGFCNSTIFLAFFRPGRALEVLILILGLLLAFAAIPIGVYLLLPKKPFGDMTLVLIYLVAVVLFGGLYLFLNNRVKERHLDTIRQIQLLRTEYRTNKKKAQLVKKAIIGDKDESGYGLEQYDSELAETQEEIRKIAESEKEALTRFEKETTVLITDEIKGRYQAELDALKESYHGTYEEQKKTEEKIKELSLLLSTQYETYLGKETLNTATLDKLIAKIQNKEAANIGEALSGLKDKSQV